MMFAFKELSLVFAVLAALSITSCASRDSEDDESMQVEEPVDAAPASSEAADKETPATAPEAKPSSSVATDSGGAPKPETPSAAPQAPSGEARVMYVKFDGVAVREAADGKSKRVGKLNRGDHILVTLEGEWARTQDGKFVAMKSLSEKGVGHGKKDAQWTTGSGKSADASAVNSSEQAQPAKKKSKKSKASRKKKAAESSQQPAGQPAAATSAPENKSEAPTDAAPAK